VTVKWRTLILGSVLLTAGILGLFAAARHFSWIGKTYPPIGNVTRIEIRTNVDKHVKTIEDPATIRAFAAYADAHRRGWGGMNDMFGVPVPFINAYLYDGDTFKGHIGVGERFLEAQRGGGFASTSISKADQDEFLRIFDLPASALKWSPSSRNE
jgi:hypothetical protein